MMRILFVDDEENVLQGLRRMLRTMRDEWEMAFVTSGEAALQAMEAQPFDMVVSDMRMPGMDGATLLAEVQTRYPATIRVVLSGQSKRESVMRSLGAAHQYLAKPCDADALQGAIRRTAATRELLSDPVLQQLTSRMEAMPTLPSTYTALLEELNDPETSMKRVGEIISNDVGMTAKILQLANSAFFGLPRTAAGPADAATLLGVDTIRSLLLSAHVFSRLEGATVGGLSVEALWKHSVLVSRMAQAICRIEGDHASADWALMGGMLHDVGKALLATSLTELYGPVVEAAIESNTETWEAERDILGSTHAAVGAYLLGIWGLPGPIIEAVAFHHEPQRHGGTTFGPVIAVHAADVFAHEGGAVAHESRPPSVNTECWGGALTAERVAPWRDGCVAVQRGR